MSTAELRVDETDGGWTWRFVEPPVELYSNETYESRQAAAEAALAAYPDLQLAEDQS